MIYRKLDNNGDYVFGGNKNSYAVGVEAVRLAIFTRLRQLVHEWWEDLEDGLPLWQQIIGSKDKFRAESIIRKRVQSTKHAKSILYFHSNWDANNRKLSIQIVVDTEFGELTFEEVMN